MKKRILILFLLGMQAASANASMIWQPALASTGKPAASSGHMGHGSSRGGKPFILQQGQGAEAEMWLPTRVRRPLHLAEGGRVAVTGTGVSSYHLLYAIRRSAESEDVALRYISQRGKPSGESPASLVNAPKAMLDITPAPLTREHQRYTSLKQAKYILSFNGKPLARHKAVLRTSNGSSIESETDIEGRVIFRLPDDFADVVAGRSNNRAAEFVVAVAYQTPEKNYRTTISAPYYVSPSHWQSMTGGLIAMFAGVVTGGLVLRRSRSTGGNDKSGRA